MAQDINSVVLVSRLTRDPELRHTGSGLAVANLRVAFTTRQKSGDAWEDKSNYADVVVFGGMADNAVKYLAKGRRIGVTGRLSHSEWTAPDGTKRQRLEIIAENVQFLDSANGNSTAGESASAQDSPGPDDTPF